MVLFRPYQDETAGDSFYPHDLQDAHALLPFQNFTLSSSRERLYANETICEVKNEETDITPIHFDAKSMNLSNTESMEIGAGVCIKTEFDVDMEKNDSHFSNNHDQIYQVILHSTE